MATVEFTCNNCGNEFSEPLPNDTKEDITVEQVSGRSAAYVEIRSPSIETPPGRGGGNMWSCPDCGRPMI